MEDHKYESIEEFNKDHKYQTEEDIFYVKKLKEAGFNDEQVLTIINITDNTCLSCYDGNWKHRCIQ